MRSCIIGEDQVQQLVIPDEVSVEGMIGIGKGIKDCPILMRNERKLLLEIEQHLRLLTGLGGRSLREVS
nr:hypothetical protein CFP56_05299 [Quercus suber]